MKKIVGLGLLVVISVLLPLGAMEVALRVLYPNPRILVRDDTLGTLPRPNLDVRKRFGGHETVVRITTNSVGLRNREIGPAKPPGVTRVLALGDSFTFGHAVAAAEAWPQVVEMLLAASRGRRWEVVNAGVSGHGTGQALLLYRKLEGQVQPDVVVLGFSVVNDVLDNLCVEEARYRPTSDAPCFELDRHGVLTVRPPVWPGEPLRAGGLALPHSEVLEFATGQIKRATVWNPALLGLLQRIGVSLALPYVPSTVESWYEERFSEPGWELTRRLLEELRGTLRARGIPLVILVVPSSLQVDRGRQEVLAALAKSLKPVEAFFKDPDRPQRILAQYCVQAKIECADPLPALRDAEARGERTYFPIDGHWTQAGHRIAAERVARYLREQGAAR